MKYLKGIAVSPGIAVGRVFVLDEELTWRVPRRSIAASATLAEVDRFDGSVNEAVEDLKGTHAEAVEQMGADAARIFLFHIGALMDDKLVGPVRRMIRDERVSAEYATASVFRRWAERFGASDSHDTFATKSTDIHDLAQRVLSHLLGSRRDMLAQVTEPTIVTARELTPSQTAAFDRSKVLAIVTEFGGPTSHTAIVARALQLPAVVGCRNMTMVATDGMHAVVDGERGAVILEPDEPTVERYRGRIEQSKTYRLSLREVADLPAVTRDGESVKIVGNIEFPEESQAVLEMGGEGVGLYRTEFLYLTSERDPTEEEHFEAYRRCVEALGGRQLIIRTVDLGADKYTQRRASTPERNPFLGLRSIRYCLQNLAMFKTQLRAILRASALGPIKVMFPLITSTHEFRQARHILRDAMEDLDEMAMPFDRELKLGMMVEVPSAAIMADQFAAEVDFFSIGTNDLVQYTLAVDRTNERVASLYQPAHPAVLKLIRTVARVGHRHQIEVSCCGEAAGDVTFAPLLIGLGVRTLSVTASDIPQLKRLVRSLSASECERIAKQALSFDSELEAAGFVRDRIRKLVPEAFANLSDD